MPDAATARARPVTTPEQTPQYRRATTPQEQTAQPPAVVTNPLYKIVTADDKAPEERSTLLRQELKFTEPKVVRERAEQLREVADHLQNVRKDKEAEAQRAELLAEKQRQLTDLNNTITALQGEIDTLRTPRSAFGVSLG